MLDDACVPGSLRHARHVRIESSCVRSCQRIDLPSLSRLNVGEGFRFCYTGDLVIHSILMFVF